MRAVPLVMSGLR